MDTDPGPSCLPFGQLLPAITLLSDVGAGVWLGLLVLALLLLASALISGSEVAFFSLTNSDHSILREDEQISSKRILALKQQPHELLATILISNNFVNIATVLLSEFVIRQALPDAVFASWANGVVNGVAALSSQFAAFLAGIDLASLLRSSITVFGVTFLLVLFGEVTPKVYARTQNIRLARFMSGPLRVLVSLFSPVSGALVKSGAFLESRLRRHQGAQAVNREELDQAIDLTVRDEKLLAGERDIL